MSSSSYLSLDQQIVLFKIEMDDAAEAYARYLVRLERGLKYDFQTYLSKKQDMETARKVYQKLLADKEAFCVASLPTLRNYGIDSSPITLIAEFLTSKLH